MKHITYIRKYSPRWLILSIDLIITVFSLLLAYYLRFNFKILQIEQEDLSPVLAFVLSVRLIIFLLTKSYAGIIRYTGSKDTERIILVILASNSVFIISNFLNSYFLGGETIIPYSVIVIDFFISIFLLTMFRQSVKYIYYELSHLFMPEKNVIIYGTGSKAVTVKRIISKEFEIKYKIKAFIDPENLNTHKQLDGINVLKIDNLSSIISENHISEFIFAHDNANPTVKQKIVDICLENNIKVLTVPDTEKWINAEFDKNQIREINIEDLLEREPIILDYNKISNYIKGKTVLVTGAAGSIGSEIVKQLSLFEASKIIAFDQAESPMYELELELKKTNKTLNFEIVIGDIRNRKRVNSSFEFYKPQVVFHAAAYKHVPLMEENPSEAVNTNVGGTKIVADAAIRYGVEKFVMISTDKAVNPTNIMGASKRIAEIYTQTLNEHGQTKFITTRFGNVLGSNGSVIPLFKKQIEKREAITITHPDITRYFMTIPEACQLVLQAGTQGNGGEIFIFDMGRAIKIKDLAKKMIMLSGLEPEKDVAIKYIGLRPGEKLYEELLNNKENTLPTEHPRIMIAKVRHYERSIFKEINELLNYSSTSDNFTIVRKMKEIVPEYTSNNSIFVKLDKKRDTQNENDSEPDKEV